MKKVWIRVADGWALQGPTQALRASCVMLACLAAAPSWAAHGTSTASNSALTKTHGCLIEPDRVADVGTQVVGLVDQVHVDRGEMVGTGQALVALRADVERANVSVADTRARIDAEVRAAQASLVLADQKVRRAQALVADQFVSSQAVEQARAERELAVQKLNQTKGQVKIWREERSLAEAQLRLRTVRSPLSGIVVERYVNQGERVEDRPLMRVAVVNPLRVELMVPTNQYGSLKKGDTVTIHPELPGAEPVHAEVMLIDRAMDAASNTFRVRLRLPNPGAVLPSGLRCKAELTALAAPSKAAPAPAAAPAVMPSAPTASGPVSSNQAKPIKAAVTVSSLAGAQLQAPAILPAVARAASGFQTAMRLERLPTASRNTNLMPVHLPQPAASPTPLKLRFDRML